MDFFPLGGFILNQGAHLLVGLSTKHICIEEKAQTSVWCCCQLSLFPGKPHVSWCLFWSHVCRNHKIKWPSQFSLKEKQTWRINICFHDSRETEDHTPKAKQRKPKYVISISNMFIFKYLLYFRGNFWALWGDDSALVRTQPTCCWQQVQPKADWAYGAQ